MSDQIDDIRGTGAERRGTIRSKPARLARGTDIRIISQKAEFQAEMPTELHPRTLVLDNFNFNRAALKPQHLKQINDLVKDLAATSRRYNDRIQVRIEVIGHTDHVGTKEYNYDLGKRRAVAVKAKLQELLHPRLGDRFEFRSITSQGKDRPTALNDSDVGRAQNRRVVVLVEIELLKAPTPDRKRRRKLVPQPDVKKISKPCRELEKMRRWTQLYKHFYDLAHSSHLNADVRGNLILEAVPEESLMGILTKASQEKLSNHLDEKLGPGRGKELLFSPGLAAAIDALDVLNEIRTNENNKRLVNRCSKEKYRKVCFKKKLSMFMTMYINDLYKYNPYGTTRGMTKSKLWKIYWKYDKLSSRCADSSINRKEPAKIRSR